MQTKKIDLVYLDCDLIPKADSTKAEDTCFALHLFKSAVFWKGCKFLTFCIVLDQVWLLIQEQLSCSLSLLGPYKLY